MIIYCCFIFFLYFDFLLSEDNCDVYSDSLSSIYSDEKNVGNDDYFVQKEYLQNQDYEKINIPEFRIDEKSFEYNDLGFFSNIFYNDKIYSDFFNKKVESEQEKIIEYFLKKRDKKRKYIKQSYIDDERAKGIKNSLFFNIDIKPDDISFFCLGDAGMECEKSYKNLHKENMINNINRLFKNASLKNFEDFYITLNANGKPCSRCIYDESDSFSIFVLFFDLVKYEHLFNEQDFNYIYNFEYKKSIPIAIIAIKNKELEVHHIDYFSCEAKNQFFGNMLLTLTINHFLKINEKNIELFPSNKAINFYKNYGFKYADDFIKNIKE